jgi:Putative auto-transporter adhesin, head GIN domain
MNSLSNVHRQLLLVTGALALAAPLAALARDSETVEGSGKVTTQSRQVAHFTGVALGVPGQVLLHVGNSEGVSVETDDNLQALIATVVENGSLHIRPARANLNLQPHTLRITVNARDIDRLAVGGSGKIASDRLRARRFEAVLGGSGAIDVRAVDADDLDVHVAGSGNLSVGGGSAGKLEVKVAGSGNVDLARLKAKQAGVSVAGSGDTRLWAQDELKVRIAGSGDVDYYGDPKVTRQVVGSGDVRRAGPAPR